MNQASKISEILNTLFHSYDARGNQLALDEAEQQLKQYFRSEMLKLLPEKRGVDTSSDDWYEKNFQVVKGYNQAIADLEQAIEKWEG